MRLLAVCAIAALLPVLLCFLFCGNVVSGGRKKDDAAANAVYQSGAGRTADCFGCVSGTVSVSVVRDIFLYPAAWSRMDTHTDRMDTGGTGHPEKQGNEQIKREKNPKRSGHGWRRKKAHRRRKSKKKRSRKEDSSTKKKNTAGNKTFEWKHCQISYDLRNRHTG